MTHQEGIIHCLVAILSQNKEVIRAFCRGNPFDKLLRSYDEFNALGEPLYKAERAKNHYKMSVSAYESGLKVKELYGEHRIPLSVIRGRLLDSDGSYEAVANILLENEVILITKEEAKVIDRAVSKGGLGFRSSLPADGSCRLQAAKISIAPATFSNKL